jgi:predicted metal-dependent phosphoesterase TrpH
MMLNQQTAHSSGSPQKSRADLHVHTEHSDGVASVSAVLAYASQHAKLAVIAITDHDCITGSRQAVRMAPDFGIEAILGEEISTRHGHLLALFTETHIKPDRPLPDTIAEIHAQGGLAIAPHPFDASVPSIGLSQLGPKLRTLGLDGIEGYNAGIYWPQRQCNALARHLAQQWQLPVTGGSDAHSLRTIGKGYTAFAGQTAQELRAAILANTTSCGGEYWSLADYLDNWSGSVQSQGLLPFISWIWQNAGQRRWTHD